MEFKWTLYCSIAYFIDIKLFYLYLPNVENLIIKAINNNKNKLIWGSTETKIEDFCWSRKQTLGLNIPERTSLTFSNSGEVECLCLTAPPEPVVGLHCRLVPGFRPQLLCTYGHTNI